MTATKVLLWSTALLFILTGSCRSRLESAQAPAEVGTPKVTLPLEEKSIRFAFIGDNGTADRPQYQVGEQMERFRQRVHFDFILMLGDNLYGKKAPSDYKSKFETPYKPLLDAGVKFFASLGNHDDPNERFYKPFNMNGQRYYSFSRGEATFFALDSTYMDAAQLSWLEKELTRTKSVWKICYFHHPLYSDAGHGPDLDLRSRLE